MEELVNDLREKAEFLTAAEPLNIKNAFAETMKQAADAIEELQQTAKHYKGCADDWYKEACDYKALVPKWIRVKESLPEGEVIAVNALKGSYGYREYIIGYVDEDYESDSGYSCESEGEILVNVTHWMPLPEPPKEETE